MSISILCVDDDLNMLEAYRRTFGRRYELYLAKGPVQGLEKLEMGPFYSVIISDQKMPLMNGIEFLSIAKERFPGSVRLMLTGLEDDPETQAAVQNGIVQQLFTKPCPVKVMEKVVAECVDLAWERLDEAAPVLSAA